MIDVVTVIISTCSLGHAAANFQQYEQYGFVPNYPGILLSEIPKEKVCKAILCHNLFETVLFLIPNKKNANIYLNHQTYIDLKQDFPDN